MGEQKTAFILLLILCFAVVSISELGKVKAEPIIDICIRADGNVEGTDKIQRDGNLYTLIDNIYDRGISVLKDDVVLDGAGHTLRGRPGGIGLGSRNNVTIKNFIISTNFTGDSIYLYYCSNCIILNNTITPFIESYPGTGVSVWGGSSNVIAGNRIMNNICGIYLGEGTHNNSIFGNNITGNIGGISIQMSQNNTFYRNNFINNDRVSIMTQLHTTSFVNHLDDGTTGNYWSDYDGTDSNGDGIGDTPHVIDEDIQDNYPLVNPVDLAGIPEFPSWIILPLFISVSLIVIIIKKPASSPKQNLR